MKSYVVAMTGVNKGCVGQINGDFAERSRTLGRDGKVIVTFKDKDYPKDAVEKRIKGLREASVAEIVFAGYAVDVVDAKRIVNERYGKFAHTPETIARRVQIEGDGT